MENSIAGWSERVNEYILQEVVKAIRQNPGLREELESEICLASSTFYKRLNNSTPFSIGEIVYLAKRLNLSLDSIIYDEGQAIKIQIPGMQQPVLSIEDYVSRLSSHLAQVKHLPNTKISYTSFEVPFFYYCMEPIVGVFKLFMFANAVWELKTFEDGAEFSLNHYSPELLAKIERLWNDYSMLDSSEIWNPNIWDNTIQQLLYMVEIKGFADKDTPLLLLDKIDKILDNVEQMVKENKKSFGLKRNSHRQGSLQVYNNRMIYSNNIIIVQNDISSFLFIIHDNPNFFICQDPILVDYTLNWYGALQRRSYNMSQASGHHRITFFKSLRNKMNAVRKRIEAMDTQDELIMY